MSVGLDTKFYADTNSLRPTKTAELERAVIDAAIAYTKASTALGAELSKGIPGKGAFKDSISKQSALFKAVDKLIEERGKQ